MNIPDWVDRATVEWCAQVCDHIAAGYLLQGAVVFKGPLTFDGGSGPYLPANPPPEPYDGRQRSRGAEACAKALRLSMASERPQLPAIVP